jgi:hypothetical protein
MNDFRPENRISKFIPESRPNPRMRLPDEISTARYHLKASMFLRQGLKTIPHREKKEQ